MTSVRGLEYSQSGRQVSATEETVENDRYWRQQKTQTRVRRQPSAYVTEVAVTSSVAALSAQAVVACTAAGKLRYAPRFIVTKLDLAVIISSIRILTIDLLND